MSPLEAPICQFEPESSEPRASIPRSDTSTTWGPKGWQAAIPIWGQIRSQQSVGLAQAPGWTVRGAWQGHLGSDEHGSNEHAELPVDLSKRRVDRAGHVLRASAQGLDVGRDVLADALDVADEFRASNEGALDRARDDLLGLSRHVSAREFSDRLKRVDTISGKLAREPSLRLSRMRDNAGCRLVVASLATLEDVTARIVHGCNGELVRAIDYVDKPRPIGYRGIHLILRYEGRLAEIQLRTQLMHKWAQLSEGVQSIEVRESSAGSGDPPATWLRDLGEVLAIEDRGETISEDLQSRVASAPLDLVQTLTVRWRS